MKKIFILLFIAMLLAGCSNNKNTNPTQTQNNTNQESTESAASSKVIAPDFELKDLNGNTVKLSSLRDKNVIINFWATWCGFCVEEMPDLQKLQNTYKNDLVILAVNVGETKEEVQKFMDENNLDLKAVLDEKNEVADIYGVRSFPTSVAVNKKGEAVASYSGMLTYEQMEQLYGFFEKND